MPFRLAPRCPPVTRSHTQSTLVAVKRTQRRFPQIVRAQPPPSPSPGDNLRVTSSLFRRRSHFNPPRSGQRRLRRPRSQHTLPDRVKVTGLRKLVRATIYARVNQPGK